MGLSFPTCKRQVIQDEKRKAHAEGCSRLTQRKSVHFRHRRGERCLWCIVSGALPGLRHGRAAASLLTCVGPLPGKGALVAFLPQDLGSSAASPPGPAPWAGFEESLLPLSPGCWGRGPVRLSGPPTWTRVYPTLTEPACRGLQEAGASFVPGDPAQRCGGGLRAHGLAVPRRHAARRHWGSVPALPTAPATQTGHARWHAHEKAPSPVSNLM